MVIGKVKLTKMNRRMKENGKLKDKRKNFGTVSGVVGKGENKDNIDSDNNNNN